MMRYYDPIRNWRRIQPHLAKAESVLVRDFNKFTYGRWRQKFAAGMFPMSSSCDWWCEHRGFPSVLAVCQAQRAIGWSITTWY